MRVQGPFFYRWMLGWGLALALAGCGASYPKDGIERSVRELFKKELGVDVETKLAGKTLYVAFGLRSLVSKNLELPRETTDKLEGAMLSISRITLSTDAEVEFMVIEARDDLWGVSATLIRRTKDLKDLLYWGISKPDFDQRLVLEIRQPHGQYQVPASAAAADRSGPPSVKDWNGLTLPEFMGRWVASRLNLGARINPFLGVLLGIERLDSDYRAEDRTLALAVSNYSSFSSTEAVALSMKLLKNSVEEQMAQVEKKYGDELARSHPEAAPWADRVLILNSNGETLLEIKREEWNFSHDSVQKENSGKT